MPPWHIDRSDRRILARPVAVRCRRSRPSRRGSTAARPKAAPPTPRRRRVSGDDRMDLRRARSDRAHGEGLQDSGRRVRTSFPKRSSIPSSPKIATSSGCRSFRTRSARCITRTSTSICPEGTDRDGLGLGMGSNVGNSMDLIEYGAGNDADIFPDGTTKVLEEGLALPLRGALPPVRRGNVRPDDASASSSIPRAWCRSTSSPRTASARASATNGCSIASASKICCCAPGTSCRSTSRRCLPAR